MSDAGRHRDGGGRATRRPRQVAGTAVALVACALGACALGGCALGGWTAGREGAPPLALATAPAPEPSAAPTVAAAHAAAIRELIGATGSLDRELARIDLLVAQLRAEAPDLPDPVWTNLTGRLRDREALLALYVPVYARHLAESEVRGLVEFYRSPIGARALAAQERIRTDSQRAAAALATRAFGELSGVPETVPPAADAGGAGTGAEAPPSPPHADAIRELIEVSNVIPAAQATMRRLLHSARSNPLLRDTPPAAWTRAEQQLTDAEALLAIWVPAYAANLAEPDVRALTAFYRSPLGARVATALPAIQGDLAQESQRYGTRAARAAIREVLGPLPTWRPRPPRAGP